MEIYPSRNSTTDSADEPILKKGQPLDTSAHHLAAWSELLISLLGFYAAGAVFLNSYFGRTLLPLGKPFGLIRKGPPKG